MNALHFAANAVLAQAAKPKQGGGIVSLLPILAIFGVMYFLMIRPQQRQRRQHQSLLSDLKQGDKVVAAGMQGTVRKVEDGTISLQVAENVVIKFEKSAITKVIQKT